MCDSKCYTCTYYKYINMICRGIMDCSPPEEYCDEESENFLTEDGCYRYVETRESDD